MQNKLTVIKNRKVNCNFCGLNKQNFFKCGEMYKLGNIVAHYYCVLLSSKLCQRGRDEEGILGFLYEDIQEELERTSNILCVYCKKGHASIKCSYKQCRKTFHRPCGLRNGCLNQFIGKFQSFCHNHYPFQDIPKHILQEASKTKPTCYICYDRLNIGNKKHFLWAPCCLKAWYHKYCVQKLANSAGYFFRCPACNDDKKFNTWVQEFGIFIPQQDASWELVPNAFDDLLFKYNTCDAKICLCPNGRQGIEEDQKWEVILCESCGSQGIHVACRGLKCSNSEWECSDCEKITQNIKLSTKINSKSEKDEGSSEILKAVEICRKKRPRASSDVENHVLDKRKKCKQDLQEEEIEVDVETVDEELKADKIKKTNQESKDTCESLQSDSTEAKEIDPQEVLTTVRPGPLSYKLGLIRKAFKNPDELSRTTIEELVGSTRVKREDLVVLSDSEEERESRSRGEKEDTEIVGAKPEDVIVLSDSDEEREADDAKILGDLHYISEKHSPTISPKEELKITIDSRSDTNEKLLKSVSVSRNNGRVQEEISISLNDFDILALMTFHTSEDQNDGSVTDFQNLTAQNSVNPVTHISIFPWYPENETFTQNFKPVETDSKKEELKRVIDDEVIILPD